MSTHRHLPIAEICRRLRIAGIPLLLTFFAVNVYGAGSHSRGASAPTATAASGWTKVADEWTSFTVSGTQLVRYGTGSTWVQKTVSGRVPCTNAFFGSDPAVGITKQCQVMTNVATSSSPVPVPAITAFSAAPATITAGSLATLTWTVSNATTLNINNSVGEVTGTQATVAPSTTTTYTLTATNSTGSATSTATVIVMPAAPPSTASAARAVPNNIVPTAWQPCTSGVCYFDGLRQVRFGTGNKWVVKTYLSEFWAYYCSVATFGADPAPGEAKTCQIANVRETGTIAAPTSCYNSADGCPTVDLTKIPLGSNGYSELRIKPDSTVLDQTGDGGSFRTECAYSHMAFDDPIVYAGKPGVAHLHAFFGNTDANAFSTVQSVANSGNSTCSGGIANRTAYWIPALIDTRTGAPIVPAFTIWYYKTYVVPAAPLSATKALPSGLRMVAGDMHSTGPQAMTGWDCFGVSGTSSATIPNCGVGESVQMEVRFPNCWDGTNLDSTDHKSHMAYSLGAEGCPSTHQVAVPQITLNVRYLVQNTDDPKYWRLSSDHLPVAPGLSAHADWFDGWMPSVRDTWVRNCEQRPVNCEVDILGDGTRLY